MPLRSNELGIVSQKAVIIVLFASLQEYLDTSDHLPAPGGLTVAVVSLKGDAPRYDDTDFSEATVGVNRAARLRHAKSTGS